MPLEDETLRFVDIATMAGDRRVHTRTIKRQAKTDPDFPALSLIGGKLYATVRSWEEYKRLILNRGLATRQAPSPLEHSATNKNREVAS